MRLANLCDEDLVRVSKLKTRKGTATSDARRAQQILYSRNITHGGYGTRHSSEFPTTLDRNIVRDRKTFAEEHGCTLEEYQEREKKRRANNG